MDTLDFTLLAGEKSIVNVASVPQRSPFRYPGGKTWLVPQIRRWFSSLPTKPSLFVEPFAGGGIIGLTVAFENLAEQVILVELDEQISSVWEMLIGGDVKWLANRILNFKMTPETLREELKSDDNSLGERAFRTLLKNRTSHGGIMAPGAGVIKHGENGKGIASRWYPQTLARRIMDIGCIRNRIVFFQSDGISEMKRYAEREDVVYFIDPPYTAAGKRAGTRLYTHHELDHEELFGLARRLHGDFLMTYDNAEGVRLLAEHHGFDAIPISMKNTHNAQMTELVIGKNLDWIKQTNTPDLL